MSWFDCRCRNYHSDNIKYKAVLELGRQRYTASYYPNEELIDEKEKKYNGCACRKSREATAKPTNLLMTVGRYRNLRDNPRLEHGDIVARNTAAHKLLTEDVPDISDAAQIILTETPYRANFVFPTTHLLAGVALAIFGAYRAMRMFF